MCEFDFSKTMKALSLYDIGDLRVVDLPIPKPQSDEVLVKIKNCGICGSDIGRVFEHGTYFFPTVPGHEFAGQVVYDTDGVWTNKRVAIFPLLPCFNCDMCKLGNYAECSNYDYYGSRRDGAFSQYIAVKKFNLVELPDSVSFEQAAMCEPTAVAIHAFSKLDVKNKNSILISGAGPIGLILGQLAKNTGINKVCYVEIDQNKINFLRQNGFELYDANCDYKFDCAIEGTGSSSALATLLGAVKPFSEIVLMGNPAKDMNLTQKQYWHILRGELKLLGTWNSLYNDRVNDWKNAIEYIASGKVNLSNLITHRVELDKTFDALKMMRDRKEFFCKVMIENER